VYPMPGRFLFGPLMRRIGPLCLILPKLVLADIWSPRLAERELPVERSGGVASVYSSDVDDPVLGALGMGAWFGKRKE